MKSVNKIKVIILKPLGNIPNNNIVKNKNTNMLRKTAVMYIRKYFFVTA